MQRTICISTLELFVRGLPCLHCGLTTFLSLLSSKHESSVAGVLRREIMLVASYVWHSTSPVVKGVLILKVEGSNYTTRV